MNPPGPPNPAPYDSTNEPLAMSKDSPAVAFASVTVGAAPRNRTDFSAGLWSKAYGPIDVTPAGMVTSVRLLRSNVLGPIAVTP